MWDEHKYQSGLDREMAEFDKLSSKKDTEILKIDDDVQKLQTLIRVRRKCENSGDNEENDTKSVVLAALDEAIDNRINYIRSGLGGIYDRA